MRLDKTRYYQAGGQVMPEDPAMQGGAPESAPMPEEQGAPMGGEEQMMQQLQQIAGQLLDSLMQQIQDPQAVAAILQMALDMLQGAAGGEQMPQQALLQRKGGRVVRIR